MNRGKGMDVIALKHLKKYYGQAVGVEDVSFSVAKGEIHGFIGPNGAGKSTVIRVLMGLINKTAGDALLFDAPPSHQMNKKIGYLPSEVNMYDELTAFEQLRFFAEVRKCSLERMHQLAKRLDLDLTRKIRDLSFGNKKKVGIIAALLHEPELIILDEPTSGLDPLIQQQFFALLVEEKQKGNTILLSSHVLNEIEKVCDRISLIKMGRVLFTDTITALKASHYKKVVLSPAIDLDIDGLQVIKRQNKHTIYSYQGDVNVLIGKLSQYKWDTLNIMDLELEEIFMHFYKKEGAQNE